MILTEPHQASAASPLGFPPDGILQRLAVVEAGLRVQQEMVGDAAAVPPLSAAIQALKILNRASGDAKHVWKEKANTGPQKGSDKKLEQFGFKAVIGPAFAPLVVATALSPRSVRTESCGDDVAFHLSTKTSFEALGAGFTAQRQKEYEDVADEGERDEAATQQEYEEIVGEGVHGEAAQQQNEYEEAVDEGANDVMDDDSQWVSAEDNKDLLALAQWHGSYPPLHAIPAAAADPEDNGDSLLSGGAHEEDDEAQVHNGAAHESRGLLTVEAEVTRRNLPMDGTRADRICRLLADGWLPPPTPASSVAS
eukprot:CAMPEP_0172668526 /NCGR_PEP_ID=MMETSP1074-20121228/9119_1 /TAXON_ID=2916 /ORGANISM="Ceratium fusus, Strain PA161109" /LENGTH=308 /DNA_ID=CAMNT_0013485187 /DNA_START=160 /DNA_END=1086 /DNA_ORIENTATION=-